MRDFNACCSFECVDQFQYGNAVAGSEVEDFHIIQRLATQHAVHGDHVSLSQVDNIDIVADAGRREGDIEKVWANPERANKVLGWKATETLADTLASAWKWQERLRERGIM